MVIFRNVAGLFMVFLDAVEADDKISMDIKRDHLMKIMLFSNLMIS